MTAGISAEAGLRFALLVLAALGTTPARAGRIALTSEDLGVLSTEEKGFDLEHQAICGTDTIPGELGQGSTVDSIRGIQWNSIFKTAEQFVEHRRNDNEALQEQIDTLKKEISELTEERDKNGVPVLKNADLHDLIGDAVRKNFGSVSAAQGKLCWAGGMEANEKTNEDFEESLAPKLEEHSTDIQMVQGVCNEMLLKGDHYVNMCEELCNSLGKTAARLSAESKRVKALIDLEERIGRLESEVSAKETEAKRIKEQIQQCLADQELLSGHKKNLGDLNDVIRQEKINIFKVWHSLSAAKDDLGALAQDNKKLLSRTKALEDFADGEGRTKEHLRHDLSVLKRDYEGLTDKLQKQSQEVERVDGMVNVTSRAAEVVIEFKTSLERLLLVWIEYYKKSVIEPLQQVEKSFPAADFPDMMQLKESTREHTKALAAFCKSEHTQAALRSAPSVPELPQICDEQILDWESLVGTMDSHVQQRQAEQIQFVRDLAANLSAVEKKWAYSGPKKTGVRGEVEGVWPVRSYFYSTDFYKRYLKGWKALDDRFVQHLRRQGWQGSAEDLFDGRWMRLCDKLDASFKDSETLLEAAQRQLQDLVAALKDLGAEVDRVGADFDRAKDRHEIAEGKVDKAKADLDAMREKEAEMSRKVDDLTKRHTVSLDNLKEAERVYVSTHVETLEKN